MSVYGDEANMAQEMAISGYDEELVRRAAAEVNLSVTNAHMVHDWSKVLDSPAMKVGVQKMS